MLRGDFLAGMVLVSLLSLCALVLLCPALLQPRYIRLQSQAAPAPAALLEWSLARTLPHDRSCFTQGITFRDNNTVIETCGLYSQSRIQEVDITAGTIRRFIRMPREVFAEGLAISTAADGSKELSVMTWREKTLFVYDLASLRLKSQLAYPYDGWGLTYDEKRKRFYATDGSATVYEYTLDPNHASLPRGARAIKVIGQHRITLNGHPIPMLNELELVGENSLYLNIWQSDYLLQVDIASGWSVTGLVNLSPLHETRFGDVLNGIAWNPNQPRGRLLVTGKFWDSMFHIDLGKPGITARDYSLADQPSVRESSS